MAETTRVPKYIVIEGPIGVGKTSLAKLLAEEFGSDLILEDPNGNPFLERFYREPRQAALATQLFFLTQRARQIQAMRQSDMFNPVRVADFLIDKDQLFAEINLDRSEFTLYQQIYTHLTIGTPVPDLVVYLQAPVDVLLKRIAKRGRAYERTIKPSYLTRVNDAYTKFFFHYDDAPLLIVNASQVDFINHARDFNELVTQIRLTINGRHYFNPLPFGF